MGFHRCGNSLHLLQIPLNVDNVGFRISMEDQIFLRAYFRIQDSSLIFCGCFLHHLGVFFNLAQNPRNTSRAESGMYRENSSHCLCQCFTSHSQGPGIFWGALILIQGHLISLENKSIARMTPSNYEHLPNQTPSLQQNHSQCYLYVDMHTRQC